MKRTLIASAALLAALALPISPTIAKSPEPCRYVWGGDLCPDHGIGPDWYRFRAGPSADHYASQAKLDCYTTRCTYLAERLFIDARLQTRDEIMTECMRREIILGN